MKKYLNPNSQELNEHIEGLKNKGIRSTMYNENERPKNATRFWISYDIAADADASTQHKLYVWLTNMGAESFGNSVATFLIKEKCIKNNTKAAKWLIEELKNAGVLVGDMNANEKVDYLKTRGISLYVIWRSRNDGDSSAENQFSNHFVLIQNSQIHHKGGYYEVEQE